MAAVSLALPVSQARTLLIFTINFIDGESFPVQKTDGMILAPLRSSRTLLELFHNKAESISVNV